MRVCVSELDCVAIDMAGERPPGPNKSYRYISLAGSLHARTPAGCASLTVSAWMDHHLSLTMLYFGLFPFGQVAPLVFALQDSGASPRINKSWVGRYLNCLHRFWRQARSFASTRSFREVLFCSCQLVFKLLMSQKLILEAPKLSWQLKNGAASSIFKLPFLSF